MQKIVINRCWGGFGVSQAAMEHMGMEWDGYGYVDVSRDDPRLVAAVEQLGDRANGAMSELTIVYVPDGVQWQIDDYDGMESVHEVHRTWG